MWEIAHSAAAAESNFRHSQRNFLSHFACDIIAAGRGHFFRTSISPLPAARPTCAHTHNINKTLGNHGNGLSANESNFFQPNAVCVIKAVNASANSRFMFALLCYLSSCGAKCHWLERYKYAQQLQTLLPAALLLIHIAVVHNNCSLYKNRKLITYNLED